MENGSLFYGCGVKNDLIVLRRPLFSLCRALSHTDRRFVEPGEFPGKTA